MTTPTAGRAGLCKVSATLGGSYTTVANAVPDASGWIVPELTDVTRQGDAAQRMMSSGYYKNQLVLTGPYDPAEAGMAILLTNKATGAMGVQYLPDGTNGYKQEMIVSEFKLSHAPGSDASKFSITLVPATGTAPVTAP